MDKALRTKFNALADSLQAQIDQRRNPAIAGQNLTARRARIASSMSSDADHLEKVQHALRGLAAAHRLPRILMGVKSKAAVEDLLSDYYCKSIDRWGRPDPAGKRILAAGINNKRQFLKAHKLMLSYVSAPSPEVLKASRLREMNARLLGLRIPGFFPTPRVVVELLVDMAEICTNQEVLEPSAGSGSIADVILEEIPSAHLTLIELSSTLNDLLEEKGYQPLRRDFLEFQGRKFDRILMNPPFEHCQDIKHVRHAFDLLKPGGRLVAIVSEHPFFGADSDSINFREWLPKHKHSIIPLPAGSFTGPGALHQTSVASRIVCINRPKSG